MGAINCLWICILLVCASLISCDKKEDAGHHQSVPAAIFATFEDGRGLFFPQESTPYGDTILFVFGTHFPEGSDQKIDVSRMWLQANGSVEVTVDGRSPAYVDLNHPTTITIKSLGNKASRHVVMGEIRKSSEAQITHFSVPEVGFGSFIREDEKVIELVIGDGDYGLLKPKIKLSPYATITPDSSEAQDFSKEIEYVVTAEDGTQEKYAVKPVPPGYGRIDIADMVLIYHGGVHRPMEWTREQFDPYVTYEDEKGGKNWFFDGFLFLEFKDGQGRGFAPGYVDKHARKTEWEWLMDRHFGEATAFAGLDASIESHISEIGSPPFKHKVVMGLPSPIPGQKDWGQLNEEWLDFTKRADRLKAAYWFIDTFIQRFEAQNYKHIELDGFYWVDEDVAKNEDLLNDLGDYIRKGDNRFYWIPYWRAKGNNRWKELGFDFAWQQPNHFFNSGVPDSRLDVTCEFGREHGMGMEMEFDGRALAHSPTGFRSRLEAYIDYFEKNLVYRYASIAYYEGGNGIYHFSKSNDPLDKQLLGRLAKKIIERKKRFFPEDGK